MLHSALAPHLWTQYIVSFAIFSLQPTQHPGIFSGMRFVKSVGYCLGKGLEGVHGEVFPISLPCFTEDCIVELRPCRGCSVEG